MAYTKTTWVNGGPPALSAENLNHLEDGVAAATADLASHAGNSANPHGVTKAQVGLGNADNTADADKPVSAAAAAALAGKAPALTAVGIKTTAYAAAANELVPVDATAASVPITLPTAPAAGTRAVVKLVAVAGANACTVACGGTDRFNKAGGSTSVTLSLSNQAVALQYAPGSPGLWYVVGDDLPLSGLDGRFARVDAAQALTAAQMRQAAANFGTLGVYHARHYGVVPDGTDQSAAMATLLAAWYAGGGGTIVFEPAPFASRYRFDQPWVIPNDGAPGGGSPKQPPLVVRGAGGHCSGQGSVATGGTVFEMRYATPGGNPGQVDTRGLGLMVVENVTFYDPIGGNTVPFVHSTLTTIHAHSCAFDGGHDDGGNTKDAIVAGGTSQLLDGSANAAWQGYGSLIHRCYFNRVRRAFLGLEFCNALNFVFNWSERRCGNADGSAGLIESNGGTSTNAGWCVWGNHIEAERYKYAVVLTNTVNCDFGPNGFYDSGVGVTAAYYRCEPGAVYNRFRSGYHLDSKSGSTFQFVSDASAGGNEIDNNHAGQETVLPGTRVFTNAVPVVFRSATTVATGPYFEQSAGHRFYTTFGYGGSQSTYSGYEYLSGGSPAQVYGFERVGGQTRLSLPSATESWVYNPSGDLRTYAGAGKTFWLGSTAGQTTWLDGLPNFTKGVRAGVISPTYGATVTPNAQAGVTQRIVVTNGAGFAVAGPGVAYDGQLMDLEFFNNSGGAMGAVTFSTTAGGYRIDPAWTGPADGKIKTIRLTYNNARQRWVHQNTTAEV